ncbi:DUF502 domain-containing protein [Halochromatium glycolicum]|jgi:uncharacterized membrane protein|uniref:DUF502 domain-containing protein n=1 Tax=Halochromatium glycolicum TaxID=85075 RepID=A0AAJ0U4W6_9GAMM|nr:DUF502 domain-containing protein [Halochromatium glycolicum]MBK1705272.1 hypothetical protein [Halochromatium glycolicum]
MQDSSLLNRLRTWFLQGIALLAPLIITLALLIWLGQSVEVFVGGLLRHLLPDAWYVPGMGLVVGLLVTLAAGLLANLFLVRWLVELAERVLDRIPLVKSLFQGLKDVARFFARTGDQDLGRPVVVTLPVGDASIAMVGFMMQEHADLPLSEEDGEQQDLVAVYLPMSYQIGGYTLYLERGRVRPLAVGAEQALRSVITGGALTEGASPADHSGSITPMGRRARDEINRTG